MDEAEPVKLRLPALWVIGDFFTATMKPVDSASKA